MTAELKRAGLVENMFWKESDSLTPSDRWHRRLSGGTRVTKDVRTASNMIRTENTAAWRNRVHRKRASTINEVREIAENTVSRKQAQDA